MNLNPEFQRQLYLEYSPARLLGIPMVLGIIFTLSFFIDNHKLGNATANTALVLFMLITLLWGARQTIDSIVEEYRERTWDTQRLSALGPWEMTWGKLFGSTIMVWYAGALCLLVYSLAVDQSATLLALIFYSVCAALLVQSGGLLMGLLAMQRDQTKGNSLFTMAVIAVLAVSPWLMGITNLSPYNLQYATLHWYDMQLNSHQFHKISLLLALFWSGVGNYRLMTQELGIRTLPWIWLCFSLFLMAYLGGLIPSGTFSFSLAAFTVFSALTYIGILVERHDPMRIKRLLTYFSAGNWQRGGEEIPLWWLTYLLCIPAAMLLSFSDNPISQFGATFHVYPLAILLILLRDCAIYLYFAYGKNPQRAISLTLLAGVLLYGVMPGIFTAIGQNQLAGLFFPLWADSNMGAVLSSALQTAFVSKLVYQRWKSCT